MESIRHSLDNNIFFEACSPHSVAQVLLSLLASLQKPLLPFQTYPAVFF
jgi:hypothetical protein